MAKSIPSPVEVSPASGCLNFRDLGGRTTRQGLLVKQRQLYRSGLMAGLNPQDIAALSRLNIRTIFDLRTAAERGSYPTPWQALGVADYTHGHHDHLSGDLFALLKDGSTTAENVRSVMMQLYRALPFDHAPSYRAVLLRIAEGQLPLVFHCSAGKDRTGVLAALIMTLLDVAEAEVMDDYLMTNVVADLRTSLLSRWSGKAGVSNIGDELLTPLLHADPDYLRAMFGAIDDRAGGTARYFADVLGLDAHQIALIVSALTMPESKVT